MKRKCLAIGIILLLVGIAYAPAIAQNTEKQSISRGTWLYVGGSGPGNYTRIQDAIDNASDGDTVFVYDDSSPYYEHIKINKSICLIGQNKNTTIIDGNFYLDVISISANNTVLSGFTIQNSGIYNETYHFGINISFSNNSLIDANIIKNNVGGININGDSLNVNISNNIIFNNFFGGILARGKKNTIWNNSIYNSVFNYNNIGISITGNGYSNIGENMINSCGVGINIFGDNSIIQKNHISRNVEGICFFVHCNNGTAKENIIEKNIVGIYLDGFDINISNNKINNNIKGIEFTDSYYLTYNNIIQYNNFMKNFIGIDMTYARNNFIFNNNFILNIKNTKTFWFENSWRNNYWGRPRILPKPIIYFKIYWIIEPSYWRPGLPLLYPWPTFDWRPALFPNKIPTMY